MKKILKLFSFLPAILLMVMIFQFSSQNADTSSALSSNVSQKIVRTAAAILHKDISPERVTELAERIEGIVRKCAHMAEYCILAIALMIPLSINGIHGFWLTLLAVFISILFACSDEYHQSMVSGRSASMIDVAIDSVGVFWGVMFYRFFAWIGRHTILRPYYNRKKQEAVPVQYPFPSDPGRSSTLREVPYNQSYVEEIEDIYDSPEEEDEEDEEDEEVYINTDRLSEDMSLRKLFSDLRDKKNRHP